jgi:chromosome segregation ATPase
MLRLTQVELLGFKSFPHKTIFDLDRGVTCIVGPNGSGKSTLADAINFAFGSQSGKELRASRLTSLIFAGTDTIRPLNIASVTLHFEYTGMRPAFELAGDDEHAAFGDLSILEDPDVELSRTDSSESSPNPHCADVAVPEEGVPDGQAPTHSSSPESSAPAQQERTPTVLKLLQQLQPGTRLSLTRRVFRDGTAGYYINGDSVRLKDVDDLFNRFNLGRSAVFSINQGEVEKKILGTPQEMREWLAEATGVALLLQHKNRAQSKLKRTQHNLERLEDIRNNTRLLVTELAGQRTSAEQHLRLKQQLRAVELNEIRREIEYSQKQQDEAAKALSDARSALAASQARLENARRTSLQAQEQRGALEAALDAAEQELSAITERQAQLKQEAALSAQSASAHQQAEQRARNDLEELKVQLAELESGLERAEAQQLESRGILESTASKTKELAEAREEAQRVVSAILQQQAAQRNELMETAAKAARLHNEVEAAERQLHNLVGQLARGGARGRTAAQRRTCCQSWGTKRNTRGFGTGAVLTQGAV